ncbi:two-component system sensor histidine kinase PmrB [Colwellia sp. KU-HH00111]|uniref:sensor histidine kinase n=1 Tax=Colwellia sp. KU-HH00111 TaxID=3127652 RepID=UPI0031035062
MSIRRYLVLTLFSMLTLITFIAATQGYKSSMSKAQEQFDHQLLDIANTLLAIHSQSKAIADFSSSTIQIAQQASFAFQVWKDQRLVFKSNNAPDHLISTDNLFADQTHHFFEVNFLAQRWRALKIANLSTNNSPELNAPTIRVIVAQPLQTQFILAQSLILSAVTPMIIAIILLSILIFIVITQGLKPLHQLRDELSQRKSHDFSPLNLQVDNTELSDVVQTLNQLFTRLDAAFQRERHFASDAAHELRTPLSVLKVNIHNLIYELKQQDQLAVSQTVSIGFDKLESIKALTKSVDRMGHVIDQILHLNQTNSAKLTYTHCDFNLNLCLKSVIADLYNDIYAKNQRIHLNSNDIYLFADELAVHLLATNLISNANKYTPIDGEISVTVKQKDQTVILCVEDSGVGIAEGEYQRVFDRFYRVGGDQHNSSALGCGLGLTIVRHIADTHNASIKLSRSPVLHGLKIEVIFPRHNQTPELSYA